MARSTNRAAASKRKSSPKSTGTTSTGTPSKSATPAGPAASDRPAGHPGGWRGLLSGSTVAWLLLALAMLVFIGRLTTLRAYLAQELQAPAVAALVIFALPGPVYAAMLLAAAAGLGFALWRRRPEHSLRVRLATGAAAGLLTGLVTGGALATSGGHFPDQVVLTTAGVGVAAVLGGVVSAIRIPVLTAGLAGAICVAVLQHVQAFFTSPLRKLFDGSGTGTEVVRAELLVAMLNGIVAGLAAALVGYLMLRRHRPGQMTGYLQAGGMAGGLLLIAELVVRVSNALLLGAAGGVSGDDRSIQQHADLARLEFALLVFFTGAICCLIAYGRGLPKQPPKPYQPRVRPPAG